MRPPTSFSTDMHRVNDRRGGPVR